MSKNILTKRIALAFGVVVLIALSICGLNWRVHAQSKLAALNQFIASGPANLARERAAARAAGIPLDAAELQQPLPPVSENAAPLYETLTKLLKNKPLHLPSYGEGMDAFHQYTPDQIITVRKILSERQDVVQLVDQIAEKPQCVFVRDWSQGVNLLFPEYTHIREAARLLKTESYLLALDGKYQEAVTLQGGGFYIAQNAASDHTLISYLVGSTLESITLTGMQSILVMAGPNPSIDDKVQESVAHLAPHLSLREAMAGETGTWHMLFLQMHQGEKEGLSSVLDATGLRDRVGPRVGTSLLGIQKTHDLIDGWEADYLAHMIPIVLASDQPYSIRHAVFLKAESRLQQESSDTLGVAHTMTEILMPISSKIDLQNMRNAARVVETRAAAYALGQKGQIGIYPATLPEAFLDPYSGKPLGYRLEGANGFVVYSVGPTGKFDGGKPGTKAPADETLFRYPYTAVVQ